MAANKDKPKLVPEAQATGQVAEIYQEIKQALGVPHVNLIFQAYGAYPLFLELHWKAFKPLLATSEFFSLAQRLRADAYTRMHNYFKIPDLCEGMTDLSFSVGARHELEQVVELFYYNNPPLLLMVAAQLEAFDKRVGGTQAPSGPQKGPAAMHPVFEKMLVLVEDNAAPPATRKLFDEIKRELDLAVLNTDYRAFARWPDFLSAYWPVLKGVTRSALYKENCLGLRESALALPRELPLPLELTVEQLQDAGVKDEEVAAITRITEKFLKILSELVLNVALAKIGMEGGANAGMSLPSVAESAPQRAA
jgi:hypothetical protein